MTFKNSVQDQQSRAEHVLKQRSKTSYVMAHYSLTLIVTTLSINQVGGLWSGTLTLTHGCDVITSAKLDGNNPRDLGIFGKGS